MTYMTINQRNLWYRFSDTHIRWVPKISQNEKNMERMPPPKQAAILWEILFVLDLDPTLQKFRKNQQTLDWFKGKNTGPSIIHRKNHGFLWISPQTNPNMVESQVLQVPRLELEEEPPAKAGSLIGVSLDDFWMFFWTDHSGLFLDSFWISKK